MMNKRLLTIAAGSLLTVLLGAGIWFSVRAAYGAFDDAYYVTVDIDKAGQQMKPGLDVRVKGVEVGKIARTDLVERRARLQLKINEQYKIPQDAAAVISLKTPLGAKYVDLRFPADAGGPFLADGDVIDDAHIGPELEDLLADGTAVLEAVDPDDAATVISELAEGVRNNSDYIQRGLDANSDLAGLFARTVDPQLEALQDLEVLFGVLKGKGVDLNLLADAINEGAPVYASEEAQANLDRALKAVRPFSEDLADLLVLQRADFRRMFNEGDKVLQTIAGRPEGLENLVNGLYRYTFKLGQPIGDDFMMADGSAGAGFTAFIGGNDQEEEVRQICTVFPPEVAAVVPACEGQGE
jgi:phospholipid/cholesterol/gamma-HCH transport system substrate-binding protein